MKMWVLQNTFYYGMIQTVIEFRRALALEKSPYGSYIYPED
jgi:hypothetical protein